MKFRKSAAAAVVLSAVMACGVLAGCDGLTTTDTRKDYEQVVAEVDISGSDDFKEGKEFAGYADAITVSEITKRDLVSLFASQGGSLVNSGYSYGAAFDTICDTLINRQVYVQYAKVYYLSKSQKSAADAVSDYKAAVEAARKASEESGAPAEKVKLAADIAGLGYFLDESEVKKAEYDLKVSINEALDSQEESIINADEDGQESEETVRATPTGVNTEDEDYCAESYEIYTGTGSRHVADCGEYEPVEGSTVTTRRKAYTSFLNNLRSFALLADGENTSDFESLIYYSMELKNAYQSALLQKLNDSFEEEAEAIIGETQAGDWVEKQYENKLASQIDGYKDDTSDSFSDALDGMSDTSFVLAAPEKGYGFVINILLPFSEGQKQQLENAAIDSGDTKGNKFSQRADILKNVKATDQRGTWFTGDEDYSFKATEGYGYAAGEREYLFFDGCIADAVTGETGTKYEPLKNYYGKYTYNGKVTPGKGKTKYTLNPNKIDIDDFLGEVTGYLGEAGLTVTPDELENSDYFTKPASAYYQPDGKVKYDEFIYASGTVTGDAPFDANKIFVRGAWENTAFSVINELSFAYNTDTAGLNTYLGYAVTPAKTDFVSEFEYAAQAVCKLGAGHYAVAPSDYGWHFIYCTFSFTEKGEAAFTYSAEEAKNEGTFSYLFYESVKSQSLTSYSNKRQTQIINKYVESCSVKHEDRYSDLSNL